LNTNGLFQKAFHDGRSWHTPYFVCFFLPGDSQKVGFIASKKVGNAVRRSRAKRRLRALFAQYEPQFVPGIYVYVAKAPVVDEAFAQLNETFLLAMKRLKTIQR